jgi:MoaA/NifB/PqqE/SkfB family radical SAM enzyme
MGETLGQAMIQFTWDIHYKCSYACPYCWFHGKWEDIKCHNIYPGTERLLTCWENIRKSYGRVHVEISGGEPSIYPDFAEFVCALAAIHEVGVTSNLSGDIQGILRSSQRFHVGMSFHPLFAEYEAFLAKARGIKGAGLGNGVLYLAYPPAVPEIPRYKAMFEEQGFIFSVLTFWGKFQGRDYPQSYSHQEREIIDTALGVRGESNTKYQLQPEITRGRLCRAGHAYALVHPNGDAYRCGGGNWKDQHAPFGNIFRDDFRLCEKPEPCESEHCPCNEWSFLLI